MEYAIINILLLLIICLLVILWKHGGHDTKDDQIIEDHLRAPRQDQPYFCRVNTCTYPAQKGFRYCGSHLRDRYMEKNGPTPVLECKCIMCGRSFYKKQGDGQVYCTPCELESQKC